MRYETIRRRHCANCNRVTAHEVIIYIDEGGHEVMYCTDCGR